MLVRLCACGRVRVCVCACVRVCVYVCLGEGLPALQYLPRLVLASIVLVAILQLIEVKHVMQFWKVQRR